MKNLTLRALLTVGGVAAAAAALVIISLPIAYWLTEGFTRWPT